MDDSPQVVYIAEHGDTPWPQTGQTAGSTDLPLSSRGQDAARTQHRVRLLPGQPPSWELPLLTFVLLLLTTIAGWLGVVRATVLRMM